MALRRRGSRAIGAAMLLVLAAGVAAIVLRDDSDPAEVRVRSAPRHVLGDGPVRLELVLTLVDEGVARAVESSAEVDAATGRAHTTLADVVGPGDLELVAEGSILYVSVPEAKQQAIGARWLRVSTDSEAAARGAGVGPLPDPLTVLHSLEGATDVDEVATQDGLRLYRFEISVGALADGGDDRVAWAEVLSPLGSTLSGEAYLDDDGRPRRVRVRSELPGGRTIVGLLDVEVIGEGLTIGVPDGEAVRGVDTVAEALRIVSEP